MADAVYAIWNMHENAWTCWCCRASVEASIAICPDLCRCNWRTWEQCVWKSSPVVKRMPYVQRSAESLASKCVKHVGRNGVHQATAHFGPSQPKTVTRATIDSRYSPFDLKIDNANICKCHLRVASKCTTYVHLEPKYTWENYEAVRFSIVSFLIKSDRNTLLLGTKQVSVQFSAYILLWSFVHFIISKSEFLYAIQRERR